MASLSFLSPLRAGHAEAIVYRYTASGCEVALEPLSSDRQRALDESPAIASSGVDDYGEAELAYRRGNALQLLGRQPAQGRRLRLH